MRFKTILSAGVICLVWSVSSLAGPTYQLTDLGSLGGGHSEPWSINDNGQIVGWAFNSSGEYRPTLFDPTGGGANVDLGTGPGNNFGFARWINNAGQIAGRYGRTAPPAYHAALFDPTGAGNNLDLQGIGAANPHGFALGMSDNGHVVGQDRDISGNIHAVRFDPTGAGSNVDLGTLGGSTSSAASVNNSLQIVGTASASGISGMATAFDPSGGGNNLALGTLGGARSSAVANNNAGQIVGSAETGSGDFHAALFDATGAGANIDLGALSGSQSNAWAINDNGQIVGWAYDAAGVDWGDSIGEPGSGYHRATLFDPTGAGNNVNLNDLIDPTLGWRLMQATDINNNGWIVGFGFNPDGYTRAFLLTPNPVPAPGAVLLAGIGAGLVGWLRRHRVM